MKENYYSSHEEAASGMIKTVLQYMKKNTKTVNIALSGGHSPLLLYEVWQRDFSLCTDWNRIIFYWVDERCVSPDDVRSNYKLAYDTLISKVSIPIENYYRILGEESPDDSAIMYSSLVSCSVESVDGSPQFDFVFLGIGEDGHTSSIFPEYFNLVKSDRLYMVMKNPYDNTLRIGMTGMLMINALNTLFFVIGKDKRHIVHEIIMKKNQYRYPASYIWYMARNAQLFASFE